MELLVALITVLVGAAAFFWWPAVRAVVAWRKPAAGVLPDAELGFAQLALPPRWRPARLLNDGATLQAVDPVRRRYLIVISESREDFSADVKVEEIAAKTLQKLTASLQLVGLAGPHDATLGGFSAVQYEIEAFHDGAWLKYLHTTIAGRRAFHQVLGWATRSMYDRATFEALLRGFSELPGPDPVLLPRPPVTSPTDSGSQYEVH